MMNVALVVKYSSQSEVYRSFYIIKNKRSKIVRILLFIIGSLYVVCVAAHKKNIAFYLEMLWAHSSETVKKKYLVSIC